MTRIRAQERLDFISDAKIASGLLRPYDQQAHINRLERQAYGIKHATDADLEAAGIKVIR